MGYKYFQYLVILVVMQSIFSCSKAREEQKIHIGFSQCCNDIWRDMMEQEMKMEVSFHPELNLDILVANNDNETQIAQIRTLVSQGIDILLVAPNETAPLTEVIEEVFDAGIPVILMDRKVNSEKYTAFISADNYEIGKTAGEYLISRFNGKGKVLELQISMNISPAIERSRGFRDALVTYPDLDILNIIGLLLSENKR